MSVSVVQQFFSTLITFSSPHSVSSLQSTLVQQWPNFQNFLNGTVDSWIATGATLAQTTCGSWNLIGGYNVLSNGATLSKTFTASGGGGDQALHV